MKLLSPREVETHTTAKKSAESERITAIRSQLSREERELNDWNDALEGIKSIAKADFERDLVAQLEEKRKLQEEVAALEEKRAELLKPLDDTPEIITERLAVTENLLDYLKNRKLELAKAQKSVENAQKLEERKLQDLLARESALDSRELDIAERLDAVTTQESALEESMERFTTESNKRNIELMLFESKLAKQSVELAEREKLLAAANAKLAIDRKRIESQQQSLIAAMAEIKHNT